MCVVGVVGGFNLRMFFSILCAFSAHYTGFNACTSSSSLNFLCVLTVGNTVAFALCTALACVVLTGVIVLGLLRLVLGGYMCAWGVLGLAPRFAILFGTCALGGTWVGTRGTGVVLTPAPPRTLRDLLCARLACCCCASCLCCCSIACQTLNRPGF